MKQELLIKTIEQLEQDVIILRKNKVSLFEQMNIIKSEIEFSNKNNKSIQNTNNKLTEENHKLVATNNSLEEKIALLSSKYVKMQQDDTKIQENLNKSILTNDNLQRDIQHLMNEKIALERMIFLLKEQKTNKKGDIEKIIQNIQIQQGFLDEINLKIKDYEKKEYELNQKGSLLEQKESRLNQKEKRLNAFKKELLSKK